MAGEAAGWTAAAVSGLAVAGKWKGKSAMRNQARKYISALVLSVAGCLFVVGTPGWNAPAMAASATPIITAIYTNKSDQPDAMTRQLDMLLGQFATQIRIVADGEVQAADVAGATHLVYFGAFSRDMPETARSLIANFDGPLLAIGYNAEQLGDRLTFAHSPAKVLLDSAAAGGQRFALDHPVLIADLRGHPGETLLTGWAGDSEQPLLIRQGNTLHFPALFHEDKLFQVLSGALHGWFGQQPPPRLQAHIRLEDLHPASEPHLVAQVGDYLNERGIPFLMIVIPVYTNPDTLEQVHLKDRPALVKVLRRFQEAGNLVVLHGYTHQYRASETGEGFEFWDVERNHPVYAPSDDGAFVLRQPDEFATAAEYEQYMAGLQAFEREYTVARIEQGLAELHELGLVPIAFEAPHYTMSLQGYKIVAEYFPVILGQLQLSQDDWIHMAATPYVTRPTMLHGMALVPELLGYYDLAADDPLGDILRNGEFVRHLPGATVGLFYHPYLGLEPLVPIVDYLESLDGLEWFDLRTLASPEDLQRLKAANRNRLYTWRAAAHHWLHVQLADGGWKFAFRVLQWAGLCVTVMAVVAVVVNLVAERLGLGAGRAGVRPRRADAAAGRSVSGGRAG